MSNLKTVNEDIDGIQFSTTQFDAFRSLELMGKLAQTVGPAIGVMSNMDDGVDTEKWAAVVGSALRYLKPTDLGPLALEILANTSATLQDGGTLRRIDILSKDAFNKVFSGRLMTMFKVLVHAIKVNYSDFGFGSADSESAP